MLFLLLLFHVVQPLETDPKLGDCEELVLVETIPDNLTFNDPVPNLATTAALLKLIDLTKDDLNIAEFYFDLRPEKLPGDGSESDGASIYKGIHDKGLYLAKSGGRIRVVHNTPDSSFPDKDTADLSAAGSINLKYIDVAKLLGSGIIHTKLWVADGLHFYVGSANMDWQSLRQKMFEVYWYLSDHPLPLPAGMWDTQYNLQNPMVIKPAQEKEGISLFLGSSPPPFCTKSRTNDIDGLLHVLNSAEKFISIEVMDYFPLVMYVEHPYYWPRIDDALRLAAFDRGVKVSLLVSIFPKHYLSNPDMYNYLSSLAAINGTNHHRVSVEVRIMEIPTFTPAQKSLQFARVNHAKFVVTDKHVFVSTSNWSGDYFVNTAGISAVIERDDSCGICDRLEKVFARDWGSPYANKLHPWRSDLVF
eukprot:sb/3465072/